MFYYFTLMWIYLILIRGTQAVDESQVFKINAVSGETVQFTCARQRSNDTIRWYYNDVPLRLTSRVIQDGDQLVISRARCSDTGLYRCIVRDEKKPILSVTVTELERPTVIQDVTQGDQTPHKDGEILLQCQDNTSSDDVTYHWYRNGVRLSKSHHTDIKKSHLHLKNLTAKQNGVYSCTAHIRGRTQESMKNYLLYVPDADIPEPIITPESKIVNLHESVTFKCKFQNGVQTKWRRLNDEEHLKSDGRVSILDSDLHINNVSYSDEGVYLCSTNTEHHHATTYGVKLTVARIHQLSLNSLIEKPSESRTYYLMESQYFEVSCHFNRHDKPKPNVTWTYRQSNKDDRVKVEGDTLIIQQIDHSHAGVYTCAVENMAGRHNVTIYIVVLAQPNSINPPKLITDHNILIWTCLFSATNAPLTNSNLQIFWREILPDRYLKQKLQWQKELFNLNSQKAEAESVELNVDIVAERERLLMDWQNEYRLYTTVNWKNYSNLYLDDALKRLDSKVSSDDLTELDLDGTTYWCLHSTQPKSGLRTMRSAIHEKLKFSPVPLDKNILYNTTAKVWCKVIGTPTANITWYLNNMDPLPAGVTSVNGTLTFESAVKQHKGNYTCLADNGKESINTTIYIDVVVLPKVTWPEQDMTLHVSSGEDVWLNCQAMGDPEPSIHWDKNLLMLNTTYVDTSNNSENATQRLHLFPNGSLLIQSVQVEDSDKYSCTAGSSAGFDRRDLILIVNPDGAVVDKSDPEKNSNMAVVVSICVAATYMILVLALMFYCKRRKHSGQHNSDKIEINELDNGKTEDRDKLMNGENSAEGLKGKSNGRLKAKNGHLKRGDNEQLESGTAKSDNSEISGNSRCSKRSNNPNSQYDKLVISRSLLLECLPVGRGEFGEIILGKLDFKHLSKKSDKSSDVRHVMIKSLTAVKDEAQCAEFKRQLDLFSRVRHENVARIVGLCSDLEPHYIVFEYMDWGDLKQFLQATRTEEETEAYRLKLGDKVPPEISAATSTRCKPLSSEQNLSLVCQLARGMNAIAKMRFVHRDLATRNCVISSSLAVKISIPAPSKSTYTYEYYKNGNTVIPLRWSPMELVNELDYSTKSDVYMYAATVWEIYSKGELPFAKLNDKSVVNHIKNGTLKWTHSPRTPEKLATLLDSCYDNSPKHRPDFEVLCKELETITNDIKRESIIDIDD